MKGMKMTSNCAAESSLTFTWFCLLFSWFGFVVNFVIFFKKYIDFCISFCKNAQCLRKSPLLISAVSHRTQAIRPVYNVWSRAVINPSILSGCLTVDLCQKYLAFQRWNWANEHMHWPLTQSLANIQATTHARRWTQAALIDTLPSSLWMVYGTTFR